MGLPAHSGQPHSFSPNNDTSKRVDAIPREYITAGDDNQVRSLFSTG
ncbi:MAG: hypothetical protein M0P58_09955 [Bacteroidales bacterium]|nr:hypothetical protein [Bacteroidales bacterium]